MFVSKEFKTSQYTGVCIRRMKMKLASGEIKTYIYWSVQCKVDKNIHLGLFKSEIEAAKAYNEFIKKRKLHFNKRYKLNDIAA